MRRMTLEWVASALALTLGCSATDPGTTGAGEGTTSGTGTGTGETSSTDPGEAEEDSWQRPDVSYGSPIELVPLDRAWFSSVGDGQRSIDVPFDLGPGPFRSVTFTFSLESPCYPFEKWNDDPPPEGQNWPARCDAFDRTMTFEIDPATEDGDPPGFEVLRAITPFGGPLERTTDITDFANAHPGEHTLRSLVDTWADGAGQVSGSAGGWFLTVRITVDPGYAPRNVLAAIPLFMGGVGDETVLEPLAFDLPEGTTRVRVEYRVTGHGGGQDPSSACIGPAEEFCRRVHHLTIDGDGVIPPAQGGPTFQPWRSDCTTLCTLTPGHPFGGDYCLENPQGAVQSVQAPRANWCPGDDVPPIAGDLPRSTTTPGPHALGFEIDGIHPDGVWQTSLVVFAYGD